MVKRILAFSLIACMMLSFMLVSVGAATVENITLGTYSGQVLQNGNVITNYSVQLVSGAFTSGTQLYIVQNKQLIKAGISVLLNNKYGNPPVVGTMYVFSSPTTPLGNYLVTLAGNSTNVKVNNATLKFDVVSQVTSSTSTSSTTTANTTTSTTSTVAAPTTTVATTIVTVSPTTTVAAAASSGLSNNSIYGVVIIVVILIIVVALFMVMGKGKGKPKVAPTQSAPKPAYEFEPPTPPPTPPAPPPSAPPSQPTTPPPTAPSSPSQPRDPNIFH